MSYNLLKIKIKAFSSIFLLTYSKSVYYLANSFVGLINNVSITKIP